MITEFNKEQQKMIKRACRIQIKSLAKIAVTQEHIEDMQNEMWERYRDETSKVELRVSTNELIQKFKKVKDNPNTLFTLEHQYVVIIGNIFADFFDGHWESDNGDFIDLIHKFLVYDAASNHINPN